MRRDLVRRNGTQSIWDFMSEFDNFFSNAMQSPETYSTELTRFTPRVDVEEHEDFYLLSADLPGMKKEDVTIDLHDRHLSVSGERRRKVEGKNEQGYRRFEKSYGRFERSFQLPDNVDTENIKANMEEGVLEVLLPKAEISKKRSIPVSSQGSSLFSKLLGKEKSSEKPKEEKH